MGAGVQASSLAWSHRGRDISVLLYLLVRVFFSADDQTTAQIGSPFNHQFILASLSCLGQTPDLCPLRSSLLDKPREAGLSLSLERTPSCVLGWARGRLLPAGMEPARLSTYCVLGEESVCFICILRTKRGWARSPT